MNGLSARRFFYDRGFFAPIRAPEDGHENGCEQGNIFVIIFIAIILIALLTVAVRGTGTGQNSISKEDLKVQSAQVVKYGAELENAVQRVILNGASENDIRFAHADAAADYGAIATTPSYQVFSVSGGQATYRTAPSSILASGDGRWEFYGTTHVPQVGSARAELVAVLPNVTAAFCLAVDQNLGLSSIPADSVTGTTPDCVEGGATYRFGAGAGFSTSPNIMDSASFSKLPMMSACVSCGAAYHYYHVLMAR